MSYAIKLLIALACLGSSIFVVVQGQALVDQKIASQAQAANTPQEPPKTEPTPAPFDDKSSEFLAELVKTSAALSKSSTEFENQKSEISKEIQEKQAKITAANQYSQILFRMTQAIYAASADSKGGVKDAKLRDLLSKDGIKINEPAGTTYLPTTPNF